MAGVAIQKSVETAAVLAREKLGSTITISYDMQKVMENSKSSGGGNNRFRITSEGIKSEWLTSVVELENVKGYNYFVSGSANSSNIEPVEESEEVETSNAQGFSQDGRMNNMPQGLNSSMGDFTLSGILDTSTQTDKITIEEGRNLTIDDVGKNNILIEKNLLEYNELALGDTVTLESSSKEDVSIEFTIVGVFSTNNVDSMRPTTSYNTIYMPYDIVSTNFKRNTVDFTTNETTYNEGIDSAIIYIDDPVNLDKVKEEISSLGTIDLEKFKLDSDDAAYQKMIEPIKNLSGFANNSVIVISIAGIIILMLILALFTKERTYEIGVLLALGESKFKICIQYVLEIFAVAIVSFALAIFSGSILSNNIKDSLIKSEISSLQKDSTNNLSTMRNNRGPGVMNEQSNRNTGFNPNTNSQGNSNVDYVDNIDITITFKEILILFGYGIGIILISISIPLLFVSRYSPRKILASQE